ncbi:hypothetical protein B0H19DRAFT_1371005, partial [Mycena capillaripes]
MLAGLEADRALIAEFEAHPSIPGRSLSTLHVEKLLAQERLDSYKYPILTLPTEIVSEIFIHFLPTYPLRPPLTGLLSPTLLTQICRRLREIALNTPALWRSIGSDNNGVAIDRKLLAIVFDTWLNSSRCCPLSLQFDAGDLPDDTPGNAEVLQSILPHRARCEYLDLFIAPSQLPMIESAMPLLRELSLMLTDDSAGANVFVALHEVPLLCTVTLNNSNTSMIILTWAQLTSITLLYVYPQECATFAANIECGSLRAAPRGYQ